MKQDSIQTNNMYNTNYKLDIDVKYIYIYISILHKNIYKNYIHISYTKN